MCRSLSVSGSFSAAYSIQQSRLVCDDKCYASKIHFLVHLVPESVLRFGLLCLEDFKFRYCNAAKKKSRDRFEHSAQDLGKSNLDTFGPTPQFEVNGNDVNYLLCSHTKRMLLRSYTRAYCQSLYGLIARHFKEEETEKKLNYLL